MVAATLDAPDSAPVFGRPKSRNFLLLIITVGIFQALYWIGLNTLIYSAPFPREMRTTDFYVAELARPELTLAQQADYQPASGFWEQSRPAPSYWAIKTILQFDERPAQDLGIVNQLQADNYHIYVNGVPVRDPGRLYPQATFHGQQQAVSRISRGLLQAGDNELILLTARNAYSETSFFVQLIGAYPQMLELSRSRLFVYNTLKQLAGIVAGVIAFFALLLLVQIRNRAFALTLAALSGALCLRNSFYFWHDFPFGDSARAIYYFWLTNLVAFGWLSLTIAWTQQRPRGLLLGSGIALAIVAGIVLAGFSSSYDDGYLLSSSATNLFTAVAVSAAAIVLLRHLLRSDLSRPVETGLLLCAISLAAVDVYGYTILNTALGHLDRVGFVLLLAISVLLLSRNVRLFESLEALNEHLSEQVNQRETALKQQFAETREALRQRDIANERQRIMRDIHDGVGGQLSTLLSRAKHSSLSAAEMAESLGASIVDLRLLIDSLDTVGDSLDTGLALFQERTRPTLSARGIELLWHNRLDSPAPALPARELMQVYRFLQEAVFNAANHGRPSSIEITIACSQDDRLPLSIGIEDDGCGFDQSTVRADARGLKNMAARARQLGGSMTIHSQPGSGTRIELQLPRGTSD